jgi:DNA polymerase III epsilon subunit-like protein
VNLSEAVADQYGVLTSRTFLVLDTEYTTGPEGSRLISLAVVPVEGGRRGPASSELYLEMNPGVPIDDASGAVHGFTDADVARKRTFAYYAPKILAALNKSDAVLVSHTGADIHLLRDELTRLDEARNTGATVPVGLADLPELPLIDTSTLPRLLRLPDVGQRSVVGLERLCFMLGVRNTNPHDARADARATADALVGLLRHAAANFTHDNLEALLADHGRGTTLDPHVAVIRSFPGLYEPRLPAEHLARHNRPLLDLATDAEISAFLDLAGECARLRCRHLLVAADLAATENGARLFPALYKLLPDLTEPGQAGTLLGALMRLLEPSEPGRTPALASRKAVMWWVARSNRISSSPPCATSGAHACPDCRDGNGCPRELLYLPLTRMAVRGMRGELTETSIRDRLIPTSGKSGRRALTEWKDQRMVAHMVWMVVEWFREHGPRNAPDDTINYTAGRGLHELDPRLALLASEQEYASGRPDRARDLAEAALTNRNTDPGWHEVTAWVAWLDHQHQVLARRSAVRTITHPRLARPAERVNPNPYLPEPRSRTLSTPQHPPTAAADREAPR